jgi:alpha-tubulin suppressor-like RCC1 family protein
MADAALVALRAATCACAATTERFSPEQSTEAAALANILRSFFSTPDTAAATAEVRLAQPPPLLPQLPAELIVEVLQHLDVRSLGRLACTCRQLYYGPPCTPRPTSLVEAAIRRRADEVGRWTPTSLPAGESEWVPFLLQRERRRDMELRTVAAGRDRSLFVETNGALLACGNEEEGEVGLLGLRACTDQTPFTAAVSTPVPSMAGVRLRAVVCHGHRNLAVSEAGQVFAWGRNVQPPIESSLAWSKWQAAVPTVMEELRNHRVSQVVAARYHCAALTEEGALFTSQTHRDVNDRPDEPAEGLGYGSYIPPVCGTPHRVYALEGVRITLVAVGTRFTVAVTEAGAVYSFGVGDGRLGHGPGGGDNLFLPQRIEALDGTHMQSVAAGEYHCLALTRCGRVSAWGAARASALAELGLGKKGDNGGGGSQLDEAVPQVITALLDERVRAIAAESHVSCAVTDAGLLYTWGEDMYGNLGLGDFVSYQDRPVHVDELHVTRVVGVSTSYEHSLALAADGSVYAFGRVPIPGMGEVPEFEEDGIEMTFTPTQIPGLVCRVPQQ